MRKVPDRRALFCIYAHNTQGGIEVWAREVMAGLRGAGWTVQMAFARGRRFNDVASARKAWNEPTAVEMDGRTGTDEGRIRGALAAIAETGPSVVVPLGVGHVFPAVGRLKTAGQEIRLVSALHGISPDLLLDALAFAPITDLCVGVNPLQERFLRSRNYRGATTWIPNGCRQSTRVASRLDDRCLPLVFLGRLDHYSKGVLDIPALAQELLRRGVDFSYTVVGDGPDRATLEEAINREGLRGRFMTTGWLSQEDIRDRVLPDAAVQTLFSGGEAFGLVLVEAMAAGVVPVTTTWVGQQSLPWLRDGETVLTFPPGDVQAAADRIEELYRDRELLARMSRVGRTAVDHLTWDRSVHLWVEAFEGVLRRPAAGVGGNASFPLDRPAAAGRLESFGVRAPAAEALRRLFRRFPEFGDGWGEWPGTLSFVTREEGSDVMKELESLDRVSESRA